MARLLLVAAGAGIITTAYLFTGCGRPQTPAAPPPPPVTVAHPIERTLAEYDEYPGRVQSIDSVEVRARVSGYLEKIAFTDGWEVKRGDLLFQIDPREYQATVDKAQAEVVKYTALLQTAERTLTEKKKLREEGAASQRELDEAQDHRDTTKGSLDAALATLQQARIDLGYTAVTSPINGRTSRPLKTIGNLITSDTQLTSVVSVDSMYVYFDVDEGSLLKYKRRAAAATQPMRRAAELDIPVHLVMSDGSQATQVGMIDFVDNQINSQTGTIAVRAVFDNHNRLLMAGMFVRVRMPLGEASPRLLVPERAISRDQSRHFVVVVNSQNLAEYRQVELGLVSEGLRAVRSGLQAGDRIVVDGLQRVRPGRPVTPRQAQPPATAPALPRA